jgi:hypothetical protein
VTGRRLVMETRSAVLDQSAGLIIAVGKAFAPCWQRFVRTRHPVGFCFARRWRKCQWRREAGAPLQESATDLHRVLDTGRSQ